MRYLIITRESAEWTSEAWENRHVASCFNASDAIALASRYYGLSVIDRFTGATLYKG